MITLDCSFRDGGYHTNWNFDLELVNKYLLTMELSRIDAVEIGFRNPLKPEGNFANVTDNFIRKNLILPKIKYFGVMINAASMNKELIKKSFSNLKDSPINFVRVAVHFKDINKAEELCEELKKLEYLVTLNLMQVADKSYEEIKDAAKKIKKWGSVNILYLADSLGGMNQDSVNYSFKAIKENWSGLTGFHAHNNKSQALDNSLEAIDIGVDWIDGCIAGIGRGPGNTETEYLLLELNKRNFEFDAKSIFELSLNDFYPLKQKYGWGSSLLYYLSAEYNIHPIYIQKAISQKFLDNIILKAIFYLRDKDAKFFNKELYKESLNV